MNISVIGAGYVGLITALGFAAKGNKVFCVDRNEKKIKDLTKGIPVIYENGLEELLKKCLCDKNIKFTTKIGEAVENSNIIFISVGTPSTENGDVDLIQITDVVNGIANFIKNYKVIVNKSTVPVGTQKYVKKLLLDRGVSEKNFDVVSNPEFLREGKAINDFFYPDRIVIGYDSEIAKKIMNNIYRPFNTEIIFTTPETAELIKYASNAFLATKISFINEMANLCNKVGANIDTVSYAMGLDHRISPNFLKAGIGFGGSCFPKDIKGLIKIGEKNNCQLKIVKSVLEVNEMQKMLPVKILLEFEKDIKNKVVSVLGLTFKPDTDDIREAPSIFIIEELLKNGAIIKCYDPVVKSINEIFPDIIYYKDLYECLEDSVCAIICTEWREFYGINLEEVKKRMKKPFIIDGRNILDIKKAKESGIHYRSIGRDNL